MKEKSIKQKSSWPIADKALEAIAKGVPLPPAMYAAIADRLRTAIEAPEATRVQYAAEILERLFQEAAAAAPATVQAASRGAEDGEIASSYALGKLAFAQLLAARVADTRADDRFVQHVSDARYLPYIQAMFAKPISVTALSEKTGKRLETVSRKLNVLRALGIASFRKEGNVAVNMLTPAAVATLEALGLAPEKDVPVPIVRAPDVRQAIDERREALDPHMQETQQFRGRPNLKVAA